MPRTPPPAATLTWSAVLAFRWQRQWLAPRQRSATLVPLASALLGLHAQVMASAELTAWARLEELEPGAVEAALWERRSLVKTWTARGTLHLLPPDDLALWAGAQANLKPRYEGGAWLRYHGLQRREAEDMVAAIPEALADGPLTREELAERVAAATGHTVLSERMRGGFGDLLKPVAFTGRLCFAPSDGQRVRFARPDLWVAPFTPLDPADAARELARRYLATYGPATREWLARWFGMPSAPMAGRWIASLGDDVVPVEVDGTPAWLLAADLEAAASAEPAGAVRLLPAFDQHVVTAPRDLPVVVADAVRDRVYRPQGWFSPVVAVDGVVVGTWEEERTSDALTVRMEPFGKVPRAVRAGVEAEAARLAAFRGLATAGVTVAR